MTRIRLILMLCLLGSAVPCNAATITQKKDGASLEIRFDGAKPTLALADLITVALTVEGPPTLHAPIAPLELPGAAPWVLVERSKLSTQELKDPPRRRYQLVYRFAPREPGEKIPFHFPDVKFRDGGHDEQSVSWTPIDFKVETSLVHPERMALRDITALETTAPVAPPDSSWQRWSALAALGLLLMAALLAARILMRRKVGRTPAQFALYEWQRLVAMKLPEKGHSERFITLLTMLVRRYLERQFALPARRQTTPEFMQNLGQLPMLTPQEKQFLTSFLHGCDAVKFAKEEMTAEECNRWANAARKFLQSHQ